MNTGKNNGGVNDPAIINSSVKDVEQIDQVHGKKHKFGPAIAV
jgi:hypothetical protein